MNDDYSMFDEYKNFECENMKILENELNFPTYSLAYNDYIDNEK